MDQQALMEAIMGARSQIDFIWNFFVTAHIAIFALLFIYDRAVDTMNWLGRIFAVAGIALFDLINGNALRSNYMLLDALHDQYRASFGGLPKLTRAYVEHFVNASFADRPNLVLITHSMAFIVVVLAFLSKRFISRPKDLAPVYQDSKKMPF